MKSLREKEDLLLSSLCEQHGVSKELIRKLLLTAEENNYSNKMLTERRTEYLNLFAFYSKKQGEE